MELQITQSLDVLHELTTKTYCCLKLKELHLQVWFNPSVFSSVTVKQVVIVGCSSYRNELSVRTTVERFSVLKHDIQEMFFTFSYFIVIVVVTIHINSHIYL